MEEKQHLSQKEKIRRGYEELAFGSVTDAVRLICEKDVGCLPLKDLNLFNVSEIKRHRDGSMEIKFADRLKALQCLEEMNLTDDTESLRFYEALERSAASLQEGSACE